MNLSRVDKLESIVQLNALLNRSDDFNKILNTILTETEKIFDVQGTSVLLEDEETGKLSFYIVTGEKKDILESIHMEHGEGVCGHVLQTGTALIENHPQNSQVFSDKADQAADFQTHNLMAVPLTTDKKRIGVLELVNKNQGDFTSDDQEFLEFIAAQVTATLERAKSVEEKIKSERLASIGETMSGLSHCIGNILHGLKNSASYIDKYIDEIEHVRIKNGWDLMKPNIDRIADLTTNMLEYSKQRAPDYRAVDLNILVEEVIRLVRETNDLENIRIELNLQADLIPIELDENRIFRSLLNLVKNAVDALENSQNGLVSISTRKNHTGAIEIEIRDNGCGIEKANLDKLFTKFFSTKGQNGTGLGLPITKKIISEHNGDIRVESELNQGTSFTVTLPQNRND